MSLEHFLLFCEIVNNKHLSIHWPYSQIDNYVLDWCHITSSLYKTDTSLRWTVEAGLEGVHLREV